MATVYLAMDLRHDRRVALKVLRPELAAALGPERFLREITITAQLDHPHILPLLDSGEADGTLYYVMPFVEGESLRDRLAREKQIPVHDALLIAREVGDALGYANQRGVIHRDIKPENILLSGGHARVADFGIAHALDAAGGTALTGTGLVLGTPSYMSPEQAAGEKTIDGRSDIYALGCVLYEMLAGQPPFIGPTTESLVHQHIAAPPPTVTQVRPGVPAAIATALGRALAKVPADRYDTASRFVEAISETAALRPERRTMARGRVLALAGIGVVALAAVLFVMSRSTTPHASAERPLVVVLPFNNLGPPDDEYFADGITEEITSRLGRISGIGVISRTSAGRYKGSDRSLQDVARELKVQFVLTGTIRSERLPDGTGQVRVTPELIQAEDDTQLWSDAYVAGLTPGEIFALQARIAERVAEAFHVTLLAGERQALTRSETSDSGAHRLYLLGRFQMRKGTTDGLRQAIDAFQQAVARDSSYALAWAGLAAGYGGLPYHPESWLPDSEAFVRASTAAQRAIALDSALSEVHVAYGSVLADGNNDWAGAEREFRRAIDLGPDNATGYQALGGLLGVRRRYQEALPVMERAVALEPTAPGYRHQLASILMGLGRYDEAEVQEREALALEPNYPIPHVGLVEIAALRHDTVAMAKELQFLPMAAVGRALEAYMGDHSRKAEVRVAIAAVRSPNPGLDAAIQGWLYANLGESDLALDALERSLAIHSPPGMSVLTFPSVRRALGKSERFRTMLTNIGLEP